MSWYEQQVLPRLLNLAMRRDDLRPYRERTVGRASGRVLEVGLGSGLNLPLYGERARDVIGLDPHPKLLTMAADAPHRAPLRIVRGSAEAIPLDDASVDTVLMTWTLCSIPNPAQALAEMRRVLRPGGELVFVEHGLAPEPGVQRWQHRINPWWTRMVGGCNLNRPIADLVRGAGFDLASLETSYIAGPRPLTFTYEGRARRI